MSNCKIAIIGFLISLAAFVSGSNCHRDSNSRHLICYYEGEIALNRINVSHCTHLVFTKAVKRDGGLRITEDAKRNSSSLRETNEGLSTVFTFELKETESSTILRSRKKTENLVNEITTLLQESQFDGIEINFRFDSEGEGVSKESLASFTRILSKSLKSQRRRIKRKDDEQSDTEAQGLKNLEETIESGAEPTDSGPEKSGKIRKERMKNSKRVQPEEDGSDSTLTNMKKNDEDCNKFLLIVRLPVQPNVVGKKYDLKALSRYADILSVSTHNISSNNENGLTYHPSRLMGLSDVLNTDSILDFLLGMGATKSKIVISLPTFALKFRLKDPEKNTPSSPSVSGPESIDQSQLCSLFRGKKNWTLERDEDLTAPYAFSGNLWLAFEDEISVDIKGKYILLRELAGGAIYPIDSDVNDETCTKRKGTDGYLTRVLHRTFQNLARKPRGLVLKNLQQEIHDTSYSGIEAGVKLSEYRIVRVVDRSGAVHVIRQNTKTKFECSRQGYYSHPLGCNKFYRCVKFDQYSDDFTVFEYDCPVGLAFDERWEVCVWPGSLPDGAPCKGSSEIAPVPRSHYHCPKQEGYYADPENCRWFFACLDHARDGHTPLTAYEFRCPFGLVFNEVKLACDWPWKVGSCGNRGAAGYVSLSSGGQTQTIINEANSDSSFNVHGGNANGAPSDSYRKNFANSGKGFGGLSVGGEQQSLYQNDQRGAVGYIPSQLDGGNNNRAPFATFPDYEISGGRSRNNEGVVLQENVNFGRVLEGSRGGIKFGSSSVKGSNQQGDSNLTGDSNQEIYNSHAAGLQKLRVPTALRTEEESSNTEKYLNGLPTSKPIVQFTQFTQFNNTHVSDHSSIGSTTHRPITDGSPQTFRPHEYQTENLSVGKHFGLQYANQYANGASNQNFGYFGGKQSFAPNINQNGGSGNRGGDLLGGRQQNFFVTPPNVVIGAPVAVSRPELHSYKYLSVGQGASPVKISHGNPAVAFNVPILRLVGNPNPGGNGISDGGFHGQTTTVTAGFPDPTKAPFVQNLVNVASNGLNGLNVDQTRVTVPGPTQPTPTGLNFQSTSPVYNEGYSGGQIGQIVKDVTEQSNFFRDSNNGQGLGHVISTAGQNVQINDFKPTKTKFDFGVPTSTSSSGLNAVEFTSFGRERGQAFQSLNPALAGKSNLKTFQYNANFDQGKGSFRQQDYTNPIAVEHLGSVTTAFASSNPHESGAAGSVISTPSPIGFDESRKEHQSQVNSFEVLRQNPLGGSGFGNQNHGKALQYENGIKFIRPEIFHNHPISTANVEFQGHGSINLNQGGIPQGFIKSNGETEVNFIASKQAIPDPIGSQFYHSHSTSEQGERQLNSFGPSGLQSLNQTFQTLNLNKYREFYSNTETPKYATGLGNQPQAVFNIGSTASTPSFKLTGKPNYFSDGSELANFGSASFESHQQQHQQQIPSSTPGSVASVSVSTAAPITYGDALSTIYTTQRPEVHLFAKTPGPILYSHQFDDGLSKTPIFTPTAASIPSTQETLTTIGQSSTASGQENVHPGSFEANLNEGKLFPLPEEQVTFSNDFHGKQQHGEVVPTNAFVSSFPKEEFASTYPRPKNVFITKSHKSGSQKFAPHGESFTNEGSRNIHFQQETLRPSISILDSQAFINGEQNFKQLHLQAPVAIGAHGFGESAQHGNIATGNVYTDQKLLNHVKPLEFNSSRFLHSKELFQAPILTSAEQPTVLNQHSFPEILRNPIFVPFYTAQNSGNFISDIRQQNQQSQNGQANFGEGKTTFYGKGEFPLGEHPKSYQPLITTTIEQPEGIRSQLGQHEINSAKVNLLQPANYREYASPFGEDLAKQRYNQIEYQSVTTPETEGPWRPNIFVHENSTFMPMPTKPTPINVPGLFGKLTTYDGTQNIATGSAFALFDTDLKGGINPNIKISPPSKEYLLEQGIYAKTPVSTATEGNAAGLYFKSQAEGSAFGSAGNLGQISPGSNHNGLSHEGHSQQTVTPNPNIKIAPPSKEYLLEHGIHAKIPVSVTTEGNTAGPHFINQAEGSAFGSAGNLGQTSPSSNYQSESHEGHSHRTITANPNIKISPPPKEYLPNKNLHAANIGSVTTEENTAEHHFKSHAAGSGFDVSGHFGRISPGSKYQNGLRESFSHETSAAGNGGANESRGKYQKHFHHHSSGFRQFEKNEKFKVTVINAKENGRTNVGTKRPSSFGHEVANTGGTRQGSGGRHYHGGITSQTTTTNKYEVYEIEKVNGLTGNKFENNGGFSKGASTLKETGAKENQQKVVVVTQASDANPVLIGKLASQCSCQSNPINLKSNGETSIGGKLKIKKIQNPNRGAFSPGQSHHEEFNVVGASSQTEPTNSAGVGTGIVSSTPHQVDGVVPITPRPQISHPTNKKNHSRGKARYLPPSPPTPSFGDNHLGSDFLFSPALTSKIVKTFGHAAFGGQESKTHAAISERPSKPSGGAAFDRYGPGGWRSYDETLQGSVDCKRPGLFRHPKYCNKFYACNYDVWEQKFTLHVFNCPVRLTYDDSIGACNWPVSGPACADDNLLV